MEFAQGKTRKDIELGKLVRFIDETGHRLVGEVVDLAYNNVVGVFTWNTGRVYVDARSVHVVKAKAAR